jgi:hypothetical protein
MSMARIFFALPYCGGAVGKLGILRKLTWLLLVVVIAFLNACSSSWLSFGSFALVSDQTEKMNRHYVSVGAPIESKDCYSFGPLFLSQWGTPIDEAALLAKILKENNADALQNAEFKYSGFAILFIYASDCLTISGIPVKLKAKI